MTDDDIRRALTVDPSPEFVARVRTQIANAPVAADQRLGWRLAAAAMAAAAIVLAVVSRAPRPTPSLPTLIAHGSVGMAIMVPPRPNVRLPLRAFRASGAGKPDAASVPVHVASQSTRTADPEILLAPGETRALRALIAGVREGRIDLTPVITATTPFVMELEPIRDLVIAPIVIAPVEGVRQ